ncbi:hypothetical protein FDP41_010032 [Naegleria fowleri]|uniref:NADP-dependent oxidoreductase domain-containing protein n=1 Tax=Naegleria fowleri TaxID=5763 RepID=A0A6A5BFG8_NAEFO|nr:uncharacterized protein FDP41_010032 [Naegleria fowleri]KAF0971809.1 hypothetical protein FDP41_010032 [Naegleria fowleri]
MSSSDSATSTPIKIPFSKYVRFGNTGLKVSPLCFGCMTFGSSKWQPWVLDEDESLKMLKRAYELGINFFDTANTYSNGESERILGKFLKLNQIPREQVVIATKVFAPVDKSDQQKFMIQLPRDQLVPNTFGLSRKHIMHAVEESLQRLGTDYIDLYIIHRWDNNTPIEETMEALHDLVKSGKVRYIGASSMWAWQFAKAQHIADKRGFTKFISMQNLYNLLYREEERDMIPLCKDLGVTMTPWSPLARGILARAHDYAEGGMRSVNGGAVGNENGQSDDNPKTSTTRSTTDFFVKTFQANLLESDREILKRVSELSKKKNCTPAQLSLAWMLKKDFVSSPVIGSSTIENIELNVAAIHIELTLEEVKYLEEPYTAKPVSGNLQ